LVGLSLFLNADFQVINVMIGLSPVPGKAVAHSIEQQACPINPECSGLIGRQ
jgi:hypothetical protein